MKFRFGRKAQIITFIIILVVFVGVGYYSVNLYEDEEAEQQGLVTCNEEKCEKSFHIHADLHVSACDEKINIPKNKGSVTEQHTHAEKDYLHLHITTELDRETLEPKDTTLLELGNFLENVEIPFNSDPATLGQYTVDDTCPNGKVLTQDDLQMTINGETSTLYEKYIWKDGDDISLTFE